MREKTTLKACKEKCSFWTPYQMKISKQSFVNKWLVFRTKELSSLFIQDYFLW